MKVQNLTLAVMAAQQRAAADVHMNVSSAFLINCAAQRVTFHQAIIAALSTLGGSHGPVTAARRVLYHETDIDLSDRIRRGERIPGFGNSVYQDDTDPNWSDVVRIVRDEMPEEWTRIASVAGIIEAEKGRKLHPNAAAFTAILAHASGVPCGAEDSIFLQACLPVWAKLYEQYHPDFGSD